MNFEMTNTINLVFVSHEKILQNVKQIVFNFQMKMHCMLLLSGLLLILISQLGDDCFLMP